MSRRFGEPFEAPAHAVVYIGSMAIPPCRRKEGATMTNRRLMVSACSLVVVALLTVSSTGVRAGGTVNKTMRVTFSQPVRLPGVGLGAGTYIFEVPDPERSWDVVQVLSGDRSRVYFMGFTRIIERPSSLSRRQVVSFGEAAAGTSPPVTVWYPDNESTGRQFVYPASR
jgi:hypothetical protein